MSNPRIENRIWDPAETMPPDERTALQAQRLRQTVQAVANVPFYKKALAEAKVSA